MNEKKIEKLRPVFHSFLLTSVLFIILENIIEKEKNYKFGSYRIPVRGITIQCYSIAIYLSHSPKVTNDASDIKQGYEREANNVALAQHTCCVIPTVIF